MGFTWQVHVLSHWTTYALGELNLQVQQVSKLTLQTCLALYMLFLKEQGACAMLTLSDGERCVTIHNSPTSTDEACAKMKEIADQTAPLLQSLQPKDWFDELSPDSWFTALLQSLGLTGWGTWLTKTGLVLLSGFIFSKVAVAIMCFMIT